MATRIDVFNKFINEKYDNISATYPNDVTEVYSFKRGNGVVATVTVVYSDSSKDLISTVRKS